LWYLDGDIGWIYAEKGQARQTPGSKLMRWL
jgi:hypothetical protein